MAKLFERLKRTLQNGISAKKETAVAVPAAQQNAELPNSMPNGAELPDDSTVTATITPAPVSVTLADDGAGTSTSSSSSSSNVENHTSTSSTVSVDPATPPALVAMVTQADIPASLASVLYDLLMEPTLADGNVDPQKTSTRRKKLSFAEQFDRGKAYLEYFLTYLLLPLHHHLHSRTALPEWQDVKPKPIEANGQSDQPQQQQPGGVSATFSETISQKPDYVCIQIRSWYHFIKQLAGYYDLPASQMTILDVLALVRVLDDFCPYQQHIYIQNILVTHPDKDSIAQYQQFLSSPKQFIQCSKKVATGNAPASEKPGADSSSSSSRSSSSSSSTSQVATSKATLFTTSFTFNLDIVPSQFHHHALSKLRAFSIEQKIFDLVELFYQKYSYHTSKGRAANTAKPEKMAVEEFLVQHLYGIFRSAAQAAQFQADQNKLFERLLQQNQDQPSGVPLAAAVVTTLDLSS